MEKTMAIEGMMCEHCVKRVQDALSAVDGVSKAEVRLKGHKKVGSATVELGKEVSDEALIAAVTDAGYKVTSIG